MPLKTDLNSRERKKFAERCREIAKHAKDCADSLDAENDKDLVLQLVMLGIGMSSLKELTDIIMESIPVSMSKAKEKTDDFPDAINY